MTATPFHAYYTARILDSLQDDDKFIPTFASSDIKVYPYQVGAALFATRSPYTKGVVLMDESGLGKSTEAMLVVTQKWYEGKTRILIVVPNSDLLIQWEKLIENKYSIPFITIANAEQLKTNGETFEQDAVVLTTYDFATQYSELIEKTAWDLTVFEEASLLSSVHKEDNKQAKILKRIAKDSFKLLLTGTPIEKNILDLYGLMYFIDESILPSEQEYMSRYFRKPENYPELAELVSKYCFRTLRSQARHYAKIPERKVITCEFEQSDKEQKLYDLLKAYIDKPQKIAFPEMKPYDLALMLFDLQGSSTSAIRKAIEGIIKRLEKTNGGEQELDEFKAMLTACDDIETDEKLKLLIKALEQCFKLLKKAGANKKAVIFTEKRETQQYLYDALKDSYDNLPKVDNLFGKKLVCADCGRVIKLCRSISTKKDKAYYNYKCPQNIELGDAACPKKSIKAEDLHEAVLAVIKVQLKAYSDNINLLQQLLLIEKQRLKNSSSAETIKDLQQQIKKKKGFYTSLAIVCGSFFIFNGLLNVLSAFYSRVCGLRLIIGDCPSVADFHRTRYAFLVA